MAKAHILRKGETLASVAEQLLGDRRLAAALADYNGLAGVKDVVPGQSIALPPRPRAAKARATLPAGARAAVAPWPPAPSGMAAIIATFGDIRAYARDDGTADPKWEQRFMARAALPFAIPLDWDTSKSASGIRCHRLIVPLVEAVFAEIVRSGLQKSVKTYGGGYTWRMKRGQAKPSTHSWGIAIDLNARTNAMGSAGDMDPALVALFERHGSLGG
jgi:hypothetical protein